MIHFNQVIAHRGASAYHPENTLVAFRKAKELNAQWIECDVRLTRDGEAIIFHDSRLNRTTNGSGWVRWKKYKNLLHLDAGSGERIIHLEALLDFLESASLSVHLEIKPDFGRAAHTAKKVMKILQQRTCKNVSIVISSFSKKSLKVVRKLDSSVSMGMAMDRWSRSWKFHADKLSCTSVHCSKDILTQERIHEIKNTGRLVLAYTVNDHAEAEALHQMGVDAVFSDYPDLLIKPGT